MDVRIWTEKTGPEAKIAGRLLGEEYRDLCLYHSRDYAKEKLANMSKLCFADKLSIKYEPVWFYLFRARVTGEIKLYRLKSAQEGLVALSESDKKRFGRLKKSFIQAGTLAAVPKRSYEVQGNAADQEWI